MTIVTGRDCLVQKEYYREQARAAEQHRLARSVMVQHGRGRWFCKLLTRLGGYLVTWGTRLQEQYDAVVSPPSAHPAVGG